VKLFSGNATGSPFSALVKGGAEWAMSKNRTYRFRDSLFSRQKGFYGFFVDKLYGRIISRLQIIVAIKIIVIFK